MPTIFCPACHTRITAPEDHAGQSLNCPTCTTLLCIPLMEPPPLSPEPAHALVEAGVAEAAEQAYSPGMAPPGIAVEEVAEQAYTDGLAPPSPSTFVAAKPRVASSEGRRRADPLASRRQVKNRRARRRLFVLIGFSILLFIACCIMVPLAWSKIQQFQQGPRPRSSSTHPPSSNPTVALTDSC